VPKLINLLLLILAIPATFSCVYLALLTLLSGALPIPRPSSRRLRFDVFVPAHNEEAGITRTALSLLAIDWPRSCFRVIVIADNCTDNTAAVARTAGAQVLERHDPTLRGKGYALAYAFDFSAKDGFAEAVVVVDADALVSPNLLESFAARIERGGKAIQAHYGILNPWSSWRTQLITIAKGAFHIVRSRARERLGLSCGVRGNGWCVTHSLLREIPYQFFSLAEDLEFGIALGMAGHRVEYAGEAFSNADMAVTEKAARSQRQRWGKGRMDMVRWRTLPLLRAALRKPSLVCLDLAIDLIVAPLSYLMLNVVLLAVAAAVLTLWSPAAAKFWFFWAVGCAAILAVYVLRGWQLSRIGPRGLLALAHVPGFLFWRVKLLLVRKSSEWVRTEREK